VHGESPLFERLTLEGFQSGLSWLTILRKREAFRAAFAGFDADAVARFDDRDVERLMREVGGLDEVLWSCAPADHRPPATLADVPASTPASVALARTLKGHGFVFVGPTTMYAAMQACGLVDDHLRGCHRSAG
jgi:DNA-3-methyladenine glycosylase I